MFYESYEQKILKVAKVKNVIVRFRVLIISVIALIIALTVAYMSTKGMMLGEISISDTLAYGENLECSSDALFSKILYYEYRMAGSAEWTTTKPTLAGDYYVRAVTEKTFGKGYSKEKAFTILPKELNITIDSGSVIYGSQPLYSATGLEYNDKIEEISFDFENIKLMKTKVELNIESLIVLNEEGFDVTDSYAIISDSKDISLNPYDIVIMPNSMSKVYDGKPLVYDNSFTYISGGMLYEDSISITTKYSTDYPVDAGEYINSIETVTVLSGNDDISNHYNSTKMNGLLEITKRPITIKTASKSKIYDSIALSAASASDYSIIEGSLAEGHRLTIDDSNIKSISNVGNIKNNNEFIILDENNNDVTKNYDITYDYGTLEITPLDIVIKLENSSRVYDGNIFNDYSTEFTLDKELYNNDIISITTVVKNENEMIVSPIYTGEYYLHVDKIDFTSGGNDSVNDNYSFTYEKSIITITKRAITLEAINQNSIYDGNEYQYPNNNYIIIKDNGLDVSTTQLVDGSIINELAVEYRDSANNPTSAIAAGDYDIYLVSHDSELDLNYSVSYSTNPAKLVINKRSVTIEAVSQQPIKYNSLAYQYPASNYKVVYDNNIPVNTNSLIGNEELSVTIEYRNSENEIVEPKNVGSYYMYISGHNEELDANYDITYSINYAEFSIIPKPITIKLFGSSKIYDAKEFTDYSKEFTLTPQLYNNDSISITNATYIGDEYGNTLSSINAGEYHLHLDLNLIEFTSGGNDSISSNYSFSYEKSNITIEKRGLTIEAIDQEAMIYNSYEYSYPVTDYKLYDYDGSAIEKLIDESNVYVGVRYETLAGDNTQVINVGEYNIYIKSHNVDLNNNYNVLYSDIPAKIEITPLEITISLYDDSKIYDGNVFDDYNTEFILTPSLYNNDSISIITYIGDIDGNALQPINVGEYYLHVDLESIEFTSGNDYSISDNYVFDYNYSNITIIKRHVLIEAKPQESSVYSSLVYQYPKNDFVVIEDNGIDVLGDNQYSLIDNAYVEVTVEFKDEYNESIEPKNAGIYYMYITNHNDELNSNYEIDYSQNGIVLEITPKQVTISLTDSNKIYDAKEFTDYSKEFTLTSQLYNNDSISIVNATYIGDDFGNPLSIINAGNYYLHLDLNLIEFTSGGNDSISSNYSFSYEKSNITIEKRGLTIEAIDQEAMIYNSYEYSYPVTDYKLYDYDGSVIEKLIDESNVYVGVEYRDSNSSIAIAKNVGKYSIYVNSHNDELNANYLVTYSKTPASIEITPFDVTIWLTSDSKVYDAEEFIDYSKEFTLEPGLFNNDSINIENATYIGDINGNKLTAINAGEYYLYLDLNLIEFTSGGNDSIIENYYFTDESEDDKSTITIEKRKVQLEAVAQQHEYNAVEYTYPKNQFNITMDNEQVPQNPNELIGKDYVEVTVEFRDLSENVVSPKNVGTYYIAIIGHNKELDSNYVIEYSSNLVELVITPCIIDVEFEKIENHMYDGKAYEFETNYRFIRVSSGEEGLYNGDQFNFDIMLTNFETQQILTEAIDVGIYVVTIAYFPPLYVPTFESGGNDSIMENYQFYQFDEENLNLPMTTFNITRRPITLEVRPQDAITYDDTIYKYPENQFISIDENDGAPESQYVLIDGSFVKLEIEYFDADGNKADPRFAGIYSMKVVGYNDELDKNFAVTLSEKLVDFTINKRAVTIEAKEQTHTYSGSAYDNYPKNSFYVVLDDGNIVKNEALIGNQDVVLAVEYKLDNSLIEPTNAGEYEIYITDYNSDLDDNYIVTISNNSAILTINPKLINITPQGDNKVYDGKKYEVTKEPLIEPELFNGDSISVDVFVGDRAGNVVEAIDWGTYYLHAKLTGFISGDGYSVEDNYKFNFKAKSFDIESRKITVQALEQGQIVYNAQEYVYPQTDYVIVMDNGVEVYTDTLIDGNKLTVDVKYAGLARSPKNVGIYDITVKSTSLIGNMNYEVEYSKIPVKLEIIPYEVTINLESDSKVYDSEEFSDYSKEFTLSSELFNGDIINIVNATYIGDVDGNVAEAKNAGSYYLHLDTELIEFTSGGNGSIKENYKFSYTIASINILKRCVTIEAMPQESIEYDSNVYSYPKNQFSVIIDNGVEVNENKLIGNEYVEILVEFRIAEESVTPKNAGTYYMYVVGHNEELDSNYEVSYSNNGVEFVITPKLITIKLVSSEKVYDSLEFTDYSNEFSLNPALYNNDIIEITTYVGDASGVPLEAKNVGSYYLHTDLDLIEFTSGGNDSVKGNYSFNYVKANITISPLEVKITLNDDSKVYDNEEFDDYLKEFTLAPQLFNGDNINIDNATYIGDEYGNSLMAINAGEYYLHLDLNLIEFLSGGNDSIIDNYRFTYIMGEIKIEARKVTLQAKNQDIIAYNAKEFNYPSDEYIIVNDNGLSVNTNTLVDGTTLTVGVEYVGLVGKPINVGSYEIIINSTSIDNNYNYDVYYSDIPASLEIEKRKITLQAISKEIAYSGEEYIYPNGEPNGEYKIISNNYPDGDLVFGHSIIINEVYFLKDGIEVTPVEVYDQYKIFIRNASIYSGDADVSLNYEITYDNRDIINLVIYSNEIILTTIKDYTKTYDAEPFSLPVNDYQIIRGNVLPGDYFNVYAYYTDEQGNILTDLNGDYIEPVDAGVYYIYLYDRDVINNLDTAYVVNYEPNGVHKVTINKRDVTIKPVINETLTYNFGLLDYTYSFAYMGNTLELVAKDTISFDIDIYYNDILAEGFIDAGAYSIKINEASAVYERNNYNIIFLDGSCYVNRLGITVTLSNKSKTYDGSMLEFNDEYVITNTNTKEVISELLIGIDVEYDTIPLNAGKHTVRISKLDVINNNKNNFNPTLVSTVYEIYKKDITITLSDKSKNYDGNVIEYGLNSDSSTDFEVDGLVAGEVIIIVPSYKLISGVSHSFITPAHAGSYLVEVSGYTQNGLQNYNILSSNTAVITINKLDIVIEAVDQEYKFTGDVFKYPNVLSSNESMVYRVIGENSLIENEMLYFDVEYSIGQYKANPVFYGTYNIKIDVESIKTVAGNSITVYDDYNIISVTDGTLSINKLEIDIEINDTSHIYNDSASYVIKYSDSAGYSSTISYEPSWNYYDEDGTLLAIKPVNAGAYMVDYLDCIVSYNGIASEPAKNSIIFNSNVADLVISKRAMTITVNSDSSKIYDGNLYDKEFTANVEIATANKTTGLLSIHKVSYIIKAYLNEVEATELVNADMYDLKIVDYTFEAGLEENYDVRCINGIITINKRPISIAPNLVIDKDYDDKPVEYNGTEWKYVGLYEFVGNDIITVDFSFVGDYVKTADKEAIEFTEARDACNYIISIKPEFEFSGVDVNNYDIDYSATSTGIIYPLSVTVKTGSYDELYNGNPVIVADGIIILEGTLVDGHQAKDAGGKRTVVYGVTEGTPNELEVTIAKDGVDVSKNYYQKTENGTIIVRPRTLVISTLSKEFTYNGRNQNYRDFKYNNEEILSDGLSALLESHSLEVSNYTSIRNAFDGPNKDGIVENILEFTIYDEHGSSEYKNPYDDNNKGTYLSCYDVTYSYGTLTMLPYDLYISFDDYEKTYNEIEVSPTNNVKLYADEAKNNSLNKQALLSSDIFESTHKIYKNGIEVEEIKNTGVYTITLESFAIWSNNKKAEYTDNYIIHYLSDLEATIIINKLDITYITNTESNFWNGKPLVDLGIGKLLIDGKPTTDVIAIPDVTSKTILQPYNEDGTPNYTGLVLNKEVITLLKGDVDVTENYNIIYEYGTLSFDNEIYLGHTGLSQFNNDDYTNSLEYDENGRYIWLNNSGGENGVAYSNLKVKAYVTGYYSQKLNQDVEEIVYCGAYYIYIDVDTAEPYINHGTEEEPDWQPASGFELHYQKEKLFINIVEALLFIRPMEKTYVYDGNDINYEGIDITEILSGSLGQNHYIWIDTAIDSSYNMGSSKKIGITDLMIYSKDLEGNYTAFDEWDDNYIIVYYNDSEIVNNDYNYDMDGNQIYSKNDLRGKFKCSERSLGVSTGSASKLYDGQPFTFTDYELLTPDVLLDGHTFVVNYWESSLFKAGTDDNEIDNEYWMVKDEFGRDVTEFYEINKKLCEFGKLEIFERNIIIYSDSASREYIADTPLTCNNVWVDESLSTANLGLADGDYIDFESLEFEDVNALYVGVYENKWSRLVIKNDSGKNVTKSYNITAIYGILEVLPNI